MCILGPSYQFPAPLFVLIRNEKEKSISVVKDSNITHNTGMKAITEPEAITAGSGYLEMIQTQSILVIEGGQVTQRT